MDGPSTSYATQSAPKGRKHCPGSCGKLIPRSWARGRACEGCSGGQAWQPLQPASDEDDLGTTVCEIPLHAASPSFRAAPSAAAARALRAVRTAAPPRAPKPARVQAPARTEAQAVSDDGCHSGDEGNAYGHDAPLDALYQAIMAGGHGNLAVVSQSALCTTVLVADGTSTEVAVRYAVAATIGPAGLT